MLSLNIQSLLEHLQEQKYEANLQEATQQIYIIFPIEQQEFPLFIKVDDSGTVLQFLLFMPCMMMPRAPAEVARLLHLINKEIDLPGFGMDEVSGVIFYRCVLPTVEGKLDKTLFNNIIISLPRVARAFYPAIAAAATGTSFESISGKIRDALKQFTMG